MLIDGYRRLPLARPLNMCRESIKFSKFELEILNFFWIRCPTSILANIIRHWVWKWNLTSWCGSPVNVDLRKFICWCQGPFLETLTYTTWTAVDIMHGICFSSVDLVSGYRQVAAVSMVQKSFARDPIQAVEPPLLINNFVSAIKKPSLLYKETWEEKTNISAWSDQELQ